MDKELDKLVDAAIEESKFENAMDMKFYTDLFNYDEEIENEEEFCCDECQRQAAYFL